jgi:hypothetical protein
MLTQLGAPALTRALRPAAPGMVAQRKPIEVLQGLRMPRVVETLVPATNPVTSAWASAVATAAQRSGGSLWFVRRRNLDYRSDLVGRGVRVASDDRKEEKDLFDKLRSLGWYEEFNKIIDDQSTTPAAAEMVSFFAAPKMRGSVLMLGMAFREVTQLVKQRVTPPTMETRETATTTIDNPPMISPALALDDVVRIEARYSEVGMGNGLAVLEQPILQTVNGTGLDSFLWESAIAGVGPDLDRIGDRLLGDEPAIEDFVKDLIERATDRTKYPNATDAIQQLVAELLGEVK